MKKYSFKVEQLNNRIDTIENFCKLYVPGAKLECISSDAQSITYKVDANPLGHLNFTQMLNLTCNDIAEIKNFNKSVTSNGYCCSYMITFKEFVEKTPTYIISDYWDEFMERNIASIIAEGYSKDVILKKVKSILGVQEEIKKAEVITSTVKGEENISKARKDRKPVLHCNYPENRPNKDICGKFSGAKVYLVAKKGEKIKDSDAEICCYCHGASSDDGYKLKNGLVLSQTGYLNKFGLNGDDIHRIRFEINPKVNVKKFKTDFYEICDDVNDIALL